MHQGNWTCSGCGGSITELPFEPRSTSGLTCRDCYFKKKDGGSGGGDAAAPAAGVAPDSAELDTRDVPDFDPMGSGAMDSAPTPPEFADAPAASGERKMFTGDWSCSGCGNPITSLPFEPRNTENLKCIDCFKKSKA